MDIHTIGSWAPAFVLCREVVLFWRLYTKVLIGCPLSRGLSSFRMSLSEVHLIKGNDSPKKKYVCEDHSRAQKPYNIQFLSEKHTHFHCGCIYKY